MAIAGPPSFSSTADLHILRSDPGIVLGKLLDVSWPTGQNSTDSNTLEHYLTLNRQDFVIEFQPVARFKESPDKKKFEDFGITIDKSSGALGFSPSPGPVPEPWPHNFIVEAVVTQNPGGPPSVPPAAIRVHVHQQVDKIWLTPNPLSIRRKAAGGVYETFYRFAVRAQFDDGTVADITLSDKLRPAPADAAWFLNDLRISIPAWAPAGTVRQVTLSTKSQWNSRSAQAEIRVLEPWDTETEQNVPKAELIDGDPRVLDGTIGPEQVPNIIFVPTGVTEGDWPAFKRLTDVVVDQLARNRRFNPYPYLAGSMNYWRLPLAASQAGISVRCEVYPFVSNGRMFAFPMQPPARPPEAGRWKLPHLLYAAGLPMPGDKKGSVSVAQLRKRWKDLLRDPYAAKAQDPAVVPDAVVEAWQKCAERTFIDDVDHFPALAVGELPSIAFESFAWLNFDPWRGGTGDPLTGEHPERMAFFRRVSAAPRNGITIALASSGGAPAPIGNLWAEDHAEREFDNRKLVAVLPNMPVGRIAFGRSQFIPPNGPLLVRPMVRAADQGAYFPGLPVVKDPTRNALTLALPALGSIEFTPETWETFAHELTHAFGLGDEYGTAPSSFLSVVDSLPSPNLMPTKAVLAANESVAIKKIKWNWHRARKASVVTGAILPAGNSVFKVPIRPTRGVRFAKDEPVLLRQRVKRETMPATALVSDECMVDASSPEGASLIMVRSAGFDLTRFGAGSLLYVPVRAPPTVVPARKYLTIVSPLAERIMDWTEGAMGGKTCDPTDTVRHRAPVQAPLATVDLVRSAPPYSLPRLVGVYFGGADAACDVVHPAGSCKMRSGFDSYSRFCHVCQYALVEQVDPAQHGRIDRDYDKEYTL